MRHWSLWVFCGSLAIRLIDLGGESLWYDEAFTALMSRLPLPGLVAATAGDVHPPLYYMITWAATHVLGNTEFVLRLPAAIFSALSAWQGYRLVRGIAGENEGRIASGLLAILPAQLYYGQEARMYSLLTLLVLLGLRFALARRWGWLAAIAGLILWTHNLGAIYSALLGGWALWQGRRGAAVPLALAGIGYLPWVGTLLNQLRDVSDGFWVPPSGSLGGVLYYLSYTTLFSRLPQWAQVHGLIASLSATMISLFVLRKSWRKVWPLALFGFAPALGLYAISELWRPIMLDRALLPAGAAVIGLWGSAAPRLVSWGRRQALAVFAPTLLLALVGYWLPAMSRFPVDETSQIIARRWRDGDVIYHMNLATMILTDYYLAGYPGYLMPRAGDLSQSLTDETKGVIGISAREIPIDELARTGYRRAWVYLSASPTVSDSELATARRIVGRYRVIGRWHLFHSELTDLQLVLLDIASSESAIRTYASPSLTILHRLGER